MIPKRPFYFLRHGETDWNREGRYQGHADVPLNAAGLAQAQAAGEALAGAEITRIVTSPLVRALKTAAVVAERLERPLHVDRGLIERSFGAFDGQVIREVKERHGLRPDQSSRNVLPADADPWTEIFERIPPVIARWMSTHPHERLLFVAHSGVFDAIHEHMLGARAGPESRHGMPYLVAPTDAGWALIALL